MVAMIGTFHFQDRESGKLWRCAGFTLVELLVVISVMIVMISLVAPAFHSITMGNAITRATSLIADQFALARQEATGRNRDVQIRIIWLADGCRALQLWVPSVSDTTRFVPLAPMTILPNGIVIATSEEMSPLITHAPIAQTQGEFTRGRLSYCGFRFRAGGGTDLDFPSTNNFLSVVYAKDSAATRPPANYGAVQVDSLTGRVNTFRP